jgi:hypothetical protein
VHHRPDAGLRVALSESCEQSHGADLAARCTRDQGPAIALDYLNQEWSVGWRDQVLDVNFIGVLRQNANDRTTLRSNQGV